MVATLIILAGLASGPEAQFMGHATYMAASDLQDTQAPGGFGKNDRKPIAIHDPAILGNAARAVLCRSTTGFTIWLVNGGRKPAWFRAADGNILGWLEAKDKAGRWKPIEYHYWYSCGNSYHRVATLPGRGWRFEVSVPTGKHPTVVRWRMADFEREYFVSNEVAASIPIERFDLGPKLQKESALQTKWVVPTLMPKSMID